MPPVGFEPTISAGERLQAYYLDHKAAGTEIDFSRGANIHNNMWK